MGQTHAILGTKRRRTMFIRPTTLDLRNLCRMSGGEMRKLCAVAAKAGNAMLSSSAIEKLCVYVCHNGSAGAGSIGGT